MIEAIMLKLGFWGILSVIMTAGVLGTATYAKFAIQRKNIKIESMTVQVREAASERDRLANANRALSMSVQSQNKSIESYAAAAKIQSEKLSNAEKKAKNIGNQWNAYLEHLNQSIGNGNRSEAVRKAYTEVVDAWNKPDAAQRQDTLPSEVDP